MKISDEMITLQQFLKVAGYISSTGASKFYLLENTVKVNGVIETRRGRKLYPKDQLEIDGKIYVIEK